MDIEQLIYEAGRLQDAASLLNRLSREPFAEGYISSSALQRPKWHRRALPITSCLVGKQPRQHVVGVNG